MRKNAISFRFLEHVASPGYLPPIPHARQAVDLVVTRAGFQPLHFACFKDSVFVKAFSNSTMANARKQLQLSKAHRMHRFSVPQLPTHTGTGLSKTRDLPAPTGLFGIAARQLRRP